MKRGDKLIDRETGTLKDYVVRRIYEYCAEQCKHHSGYKLMAYGPMAQRVGLPWLWIGSDNAKTIVLLRNALERIEAIDCIRVKPANHTSVKVLLRRNPKKFYKRLHWEIDGLFGWELDHDEEIGQNADGATFD
ncbi:hypothetical protein [Bifidobacterium sp. ESL0704]|uniref:hypothetical protein n=1 Tax=Bifidobacterium sp. ESL0704 TaxID=2983219 RepID=UPI0023F8FF01|nr:hypothetical protein [Bifidobacterium sp. ESL0704]WEV52958.1 hypothetical protein OZX64_00120 [Bifidobacterium sp. ESL0704]